MRALSVVTLAGVLLAAAPGVLAHGEGHGFVQANLAGPYLVTVQGGDDLPVSGTPTAFTLVVQEASTRNLVENVTLTLGVRDEDGSVVHEDVTAKPQRGFRGFYSANLTFPTNGTYRIPLHIAPDDVGVNFTIEVFPDIPYRVDWLPGEPSVIGRKETGRFYLTDWPSGNPRAGVDDAKARIEEWPGDHSTLLGVDEAPLVDEGNGMYAVDYVYPKETMYHVFFVSESLGILANMTPYAHVTTYDYSGGSNGESPQARAAGPGAWAVLAAGALAVLLGRRAASR